VTSDLDRAIRPGMGGGGWRVDCVKIDHSKTNCGRICWIPGSDLMLWDAPRGSPKMGGG